MAHFHRVITLTISLGAGLGCTDRPVCIRGAQHLSELHLLSVAGGMSTPLKGVIPYEVELPLYADGAHKHRYVSLPSGGTITPGEDRWTLPVGSLLMKTFYVPHDARDPSSSEQRIETRILERTGSGFIAGTYLWDDDQQDATCSGGNKEVDATWLDEFGAEQSRQFHVPGTSQCSTCHSGDTDSVSLALGWRTRQLNLDGAYSDGTTNQIDHFAAMGILDGPPPSVRDRLAPSDGPEPLERRARSYLDVNCGICHNASGYAASTGVFFNLENADPTSLGICKSTSSVDGRTHVIVPGSPDASEMLARMRSPNALVRMPRGPVKVPDPVGIQLLGQWIQSLPNAGCE